MNINESFITSTYYYGYYADVDDVDEDEDEMQIDDGTEEGIDVGVEDGMHVGTTDGYEDGIKEGTEDGQEAGSPVTPSSCNCFPSPSANCLMYSFHSMSPLIIPTPSLLSLSSKSPSSARRFALLLNSASTNRKSKVTRRIVASPYFLN